mgnify:CR=1 FL=1
MSNPKLLEVGVRLEEAVHDLDSEPLSNEELYEKYQQIAIQILDSEFVDFPEQILETFLQGYLAAIRSMLILAE